jgi:hypothetical protein
VEADVAHIDVAELLDRIGHATKERGDILQIGTNRIGLGEMEDLPV